jgi:hypothetical protein
MYQKLWLAKLPVLGLLPSSAGLSDAGLKEFGCTVFMKVLICSS